MTAPTARDAAIVELWTGGNASTEALNKAADAHRDAVFKNLIDGAAAGTILFFRKSSNGPRNSHP